MKKRLGIILASLAGILLLMQFFRIDKSVPQYDPAGDFLHIAQPPAEIATLMRNACYDCHSYETKYPWYANVAPVSWWLKGHINEGRHHLNYSLYGSLSAHDKEEVAEESHEAVTTSWMPLKPYLWNHPEARLTDAQRQLIGNWLLALHAVEPGENREKGDEQENE